MKTHKWEDIAEKSFTPEERDRIREQAVAEVERMGYGKLRKAQNLTQVEIAERLGISQPSVAALEQRSDMMLSTLAKYIEALGGRLEISAVFPNGSFNLAPPASAFHEGFADTAGDSKQQRKTVAAKRSRRRAA
ncbi:MAG TPA: XRE family transcriptional regulator [Acidobacteriaceae bacterium]|nr:XRE family transcriptional regulator [Acidobacteriaceae bacterium]